MAKIYNPTINSSISEKRGDKTLEIQAGGVVEFNKEESDYLLKKYEWLIEVNDYIPTEFRSEKISDIRVFKRYWNRLENNLGLKRNKHGNKYIIVGNLRFEIPNPETRNSLGYNIDDFPEEEKLLDLLEVKPNVTNVFSADLIRLKDNRDPVYIVFKYPKLEKRHVPDQKTLNAIRREQTEIKVLDKNEFDKIPTGKPIRRKDEWDHNVGLGKSRENISPIININKSQFHFGHGDNVGRDKIKQKWKIKDIPLWLKYVVAIVSIAGLLLATYAYIKPNNKGIFFQPNVNGTSELATSTINISDVFEKVKTLGTSFEKQKFLEGFKDKQIYGVGLYVDFFDSDRRIYFLIVNVSNNNIACVLENRDDELEQRLMLLKKDSKVVFSGIFTNMALNGKYLEINNCSWSH